MPRRSTSIALVVLTVSCTPDVATTAGTGGGGAGASSTASTTSTSGSSTDASGSTSSTTSSAATTSASTTASSGASTGSSVSSSTGSATTATYAHCTTISDSFDQYMSDNDFQNTGESGMGPWTEFPMGSAIMWEPSKIKVNGSQTGALFLKSTIDPPALAPCVFTVDLLDFDPPGSARIHLWASQADQGVIYEGGSVSAFGQPGVAVPLPITLGLVVDGGNVAGFYSTNGGGTWNALAPVGGQPLAPDLMHDAVVSLAVYGGGTARFDNFNTHATTPTLLTPE